MKLESEGLPYCVQASKEKKNKQRFGDGNRQLTLKKKRLCGIKMSSAEFY